MTQIASPNNSVLVLGRVLVAGIYRPSKVYLEREDVRRLQRTSAFAAVVHEFERQFGSLSVHLDQVGKQAFVEALLDSEPNRLGPEFREALYEHTQGHAERAYLHEAVGNALEQLYAGHTETIAVQLAWHFSAATRMDKAADYALQAGNRARGLYAYAEARQHYSRALVALAQLPDTLET